MATENPLGQGTHHGSHGEEVRVVAALLQIHHDVEQRHLVATPLGVECLEVPRQDELVVLPATGCGARLAGRPPHPTRIPRGRLYFWKGWWCPRRHVQRSTGSQSRRETFLRLRQPDRRHCCPQRGTEISEQGLLSTLGNSQESQVGPEGRSG